MIAALSDPDLRVRKSASSCLMDKAKASNEVSEAVIKSLLKSSDKATRIKSIMSNEILAEALIKTGSTDDILEILTTALQGKDLDYQQWAPEWLAGPYTTTSDMREEALQRLADLGAAGSLRYLFYCN